MMWQWNSQLPSRSGVHVIAIVVPGRQQLRDDGVPGRRLTGASRHAVAEALHLEVEAVQVHRVRLRREVDHAPVDWLAERR